MDAQYEARLHSPKKLSPIKKIYDDSRGTSITISPSSYNKAAAGQYESHARRKLCYNTNKEMVFDRMIPSVTAGALENTFSLMHNKAEPFSDKSQPQQANDSNAVSKLLYKQVLQTELLGTNFNDDLSKSPPQTKHIPRAPNSPSDASSAPSGTSPPHASPSRLFSYKSKKQTVANDSPYSLSPISLQSQQLLSSPKKPPRKIPKVPFKVLEAPQIQDDFYLNLVDWSSQNLLAVGLSQCVYLWNASTSQVTRLCDVPANEIVTSLAWMSRGTHLAVGSSEGTVALWDVNKQKKIRTFSGHKARIGTMAWGQSPQWILSTGSRDRSILQRDVRSEQQYVSKFLGHKQEVCGLKWGYNPSNYLASGGNDNKLYIWDLRQTKDYESSSSSPTSYNASHSQFAGNGTGNGGAPQPLFCFSSHKAAVKGLAWSPHQRGLLASGGGTADTCIRFWNTINGQELPNSINTGSQVCCLGWSKNVNEIVSTHGYSQNQITIWSYPTMQQIATLTGHSMRVLYLAISPDGQTIVTGAGDETLRFWSVFPKAKASGNGRDFSSTLTSPFNDIR